MRIPPNTFTFLYFPAVFLLFAVAASAAVIRHEVTTYVISRTVSDVIGTASSGSSDVIVLTPETFDRKVLESPDLWLVAFYAPWCPFSKRLLPKWEQAASDLKGKVKLGKVDAFTHKRFRKYYHISGFPVIYIFGRDKWKPKKYTGAVKFILLQVAFSWHRPKSSVRARTRVFY